MSQIWLTNSLKNTRQDYKRFRKVNALYVTVLRIQNQISLLIYDNLSDSNGFRQLQGVRYVSSASKIFPWSFVHLFSL